MDNLYVVESPLQALCALELSLDNKNEKHGIVVRLAGGARKRNDEQILAIVNKREWSFKYLIENDKNKSGLAVHLHLRGALIELQRSFENKVNKLYLGEFRSSYMHILRCALKPKSVFLLDDGTVTIEMVNKYISKNKFYPADNFYPASRLKTIVFKIIYFSFIDFSILNNKIGVYSVYKNLNFDEVYEASFNNVKNFFNVEQEVDDGLVYYYGSKYSESKILELSYELKFLSEVAEFYKKLNKSVTYFAHRDESPEKLKLIESEIGFKVAIPSKTAELYLLESNILPGEVSSACSSLLANANIIFPELKVRSFKFDLNKLPEKYRPGIEMTYDYFESVGLEVIS